MASAAMAATPSNGTGGSELTLTGLQPIAVKKTIMVVNSFVINTIDFLNKFNAIADSKLRKVSQTINRVSIQLSLLETKLEAVDWLKNENLAAATTTSTTAAPGAPAALSVPAAPSPDAPPAPPMDAPAAPPPPPAAPQILLKDDPRYSKYFKMMGMGVPKAALRGKVLNDGLDPDVLDMDPEGPAPPGADDGGGSSSSGRSGYDDDSDDSDNSDSDSD